MSHESNETRVIPSVLDRLISNSGAEAAGYNQVLRELKQSVRRDLENLLNTRWRHPNPFRRIMRNSKSPS